MLEIKIKIPDKIVPPTHFDVEFLMILERLVLVKWAKNYY